MMWQTIECAKIRSAHVSLFLDPFTSDPDSVHFWNFISLLFMRQTFLSDKTESIMNNIMSKGDLFTYPVITGLVEYVR
jgi:hypothetical protein